MLSNELGREQLFPTVSVRFPSSYVGRQPRSPRRAARDRRRRLHQPHARRARRLYDASPERDRVTAMLSEEARDLAKRSTYPDVLDGHGAPVRGPAPDALEQPAGRLQRRRPAEGAPGARLQGALHGRSRGQRGLRARGDEAQRRPLRELRHRRLRHARQQLPDARAAPAGDLRPRRGARAARSTRRRTRRRPARSSSEHTHILVVSDFCRTPQINLGDGTRPLPEQLGARRLAALPGRTSSSARPTPTSSCRCRRSKFADGERAIAPPDLLATFLSAFGVDPRKYMRDGEVVRELLRA